MTCLTLLLFFLWLGMVASTAVELQRRIIGGQPCTLQHHVRLKGVANNGSYNQCGGSLLSKQWILTAAHCLKSGRTIFAYLGSPEKEVKIITKPVIYMDKDTRVHDLMLLQLSTPTDIQPISLPDCEDLPKDKVQVAGHAATTGGPNNKRKPGVSDTLHCADVQVVDCADLKNTIQTNFPADYKAIKYQHFFCGQSPGVDICYGDSGGGVVNGDKIYGVVSFLGDPKEVCRKASGFMDLCNPEYTAWINKSIT